MNYSFRIIYYFQIFTKSGAESSRHLHARDATCTHSTRSARHAELQSRVRQLNGSSNSTQELPNSPREDELHEPVRQQEETPKCMHESTNCVTRRATSTRPPTHREAELHERVRQLQARVRQLRDSSNCTPETGTGRVYRTPLPSPPNGTHE